ncbi:hypothetical protein Dsin_003721 [Dipteronia sinensis]|uniref:Uncharacterized protein n=1 Tax=Dipteronia sinensis TaxID=43782 RepID=A0AAE0B9I4_9ROSI|nr:hypothetical protein Dsin_003721 [Dipteronia sinensis]
MSESTRTVMDVTVGGSNGGSAATVAIAIEASSAETCLGSHEISDKIGMIGENCKSLFDFDRSPLKLLVMEPLRFVELLWQLSLHALHEVHRRTFPADVASIPLPTSLTDVALSHAATLLPTSLPRFAPLQVKSWSKIPRNKVETLILRVREKFKLSTEPHVDVAIEEDMKQRYTRWRYTLHQMFIECQTVEQTLANPHVEVDVDDWKYLVELWQDESWKDKMDRLRTNPPEELQHMSEDEIYDHVLGDAPSGYIRGLGAGPKPKPSSGVATRRCAQVEAATRRVEEAEAQSAKLADELTTVKNELVEMRSNFNQQLLDI